MAGWLTNSARQVNLLTQERDDMKFKNNQPLVMAGFRATIALISEVEKFARSQGIGKSEAIRLLIERGLGEK